MYSTHNHFISLPRSPKFLLVCFFTIILLVSISCQLSAPNNESTEPEQAVTVPKKETLLPTEPADVTQPALSAEALTLKQAFDLLRQQSGLEDLAFYSYTAFEVDSEGLCADYTIAGYSANQKQFCYNKVDHDGALQLKCRDQDSVDDPMVDNLDILKDSPELVTEAFAKYEPCPDGLNMLINLTQSEAQFLCSKSGWSGDISPYK